MALPKSNDPVGRITPIRFEPTTSCQQVSSWDSAKAVKPLAGATRGEFHYQVVDDFERGSIPPEPITAKPYRRLCLEVGGLSDGVEEFFEDLLQNSPLRFYTVRETGLPKQKVEGVAPISWRDELRQ